MSQTRRRVVRLVPGVNYVAAANLAGGDVVPPLSCAYQIEVAVDSNVTFYQRYVAQNIEMNEGVALQANKSYTFEILADPADTTIGFRFSANCVIQKFIVHEITGDVS
jgi:hypothetical protein